MVRAAGEIGRKVQYLAPALNHKEELVQIRRVGLVVDARNFYDKERMWNRWRFLVHPYQPATMRSGVQHTLCLEHQPSWFARGELVWPDHKHKAYKDLRVWRDRYAVKGSTGRWYVPDRWLFPWKQADQAYKNRMREEEEGYGSEFVPEGEGAVARSVVEAGGSRRTVKRLPKAVE